MKSQKVTFQIEEGRSLNFYGLEELCDDPSRNRTGREVHAVLTAVKSSFVLSVRDGGRVHKIIDEFGKQIRFKSINCAVERLSDVPHLWPEIVLDVRTPFEEGRV